MKQLLLFSLNEDNFAAWREEIEDIRNIGTVSPLPLDHSGTFDVALIDDRIAYLFDLSVCLGCTSIKQKKKEPTGELALFQEIWEERKHVCLVSNDPIKEFSVQCFAHVLPKGSYPLLRLKKENIVILTASNHYLYDHCKDQAKKLPMFDKLFELHDESKRQFYDDNKIPKF